MSTATETAPATRANGWLERLGPGGILVAQVFIATRLLLLATALAVTIQTRGKLTDVLGNWDVAHFVAIARNGYAVPTDVAFFPGLPLLLRVGMTFGIGPVEGGVILSIVTSALAVWALYRLGGRWAAIGWLLAPTAVFTLVAYSESPFCAAAFWAWERATKRHWFAAALCAAAACTFRVSGLFLVGALGVLALVQAWASSHPDAVGAGSSAVGSGEGTPTAQAAAGASELDEGTPRPGRDAGAAGRALARSVPWLLLPLAVLATYALYLYRRTGSWTAWFSAQSTGWMRQFTWPWDCLANHWRAIQPGMYLDHPGWVEIFRAELICWLVGIVVVVVALRRRKWAEASWVGVQVLAFSLSYWLQSVCRAILLWFPLWTELGDFIERHRTGGWRVFWAVVVVVALTMEVGWGVLFYLGMWSS